MNNKKPPAFILGMTVNGLSILRTLGRKGINIYGVDYYADQVAFLSRHCHHKVIISNVNSEPQQALDKLLDIGKKLGDRSVLLFTRDDFLVFVSKFRKELEEYFLFNVPDPEIVVCIIDKRQLAKFAVQSEIQHPRTFAVDSLEQLLSIKSQLRYPVTLKPPKSHLSRGSGLWKGKKLLTASDPDTMQQQFLEFNDVGVEVMIQEQVPGPETDIYLYYAYYSKESKPLAIFTKRKLRQYPIHFGYGCANESVSVPDVVTLGQRLFDSMHYKGIGGVEFKRDSRDGTYQLIEVHGRTPMTGGIAIASGVDIPWIAYCDLIGENMPLVYEFREGVKWFNFEDDLAAYLMYRANNELTFFNWIKSYRGKKVFATFNLFDLRPFLKAFLPFIFRLFKSLFNKKK